LWQETGVTNGRLSEYSQERLLTCLYLNEYPVRFATTSDPVQVKPPPASEGGSLWLGELQTAQPVVLKAGDDWRSGLSMAGVRTARSCGWRSTSIRPSADAE